MKLQHVIRYIIRYLEMQICQAFSATLYTFQREKIARQIFCDMNVLGALLKKVCHKKQEKLKSQRKNFLFSVHSVVRYWGFWLRLLPTLAVNNRDDQIPKVVLIASIATDRSVSGII